MLPGRRIHQTPDSPKKTKQLSQKNVSATTSKTIFILIEGNSHDRYLQAALRVWVQRTSDEPSLLAVALCPFSTMLDEKTEIEVESWLALNTEMTFGVTCWHPEKCNALGTSLLFPAQV